MGWQAIFNSSGILFAGFIGTVVLSIVTIATGTALGLVVALLRNAHIRGLGAPLRIYLEIFRGSPLLVQMLYIYFGAAYLGFRGVDTFTAAIIALTLYEGALISEIFRAGIEAVPRGQREAARSVGLTRVQIERFVILPQTVPIVLPPLVGQYIGLVKDSALAAAIGYLELVREGQAIIDRIGMPIEVFAVISVIYFIICYPMSLFARRLELKATHA